MALIAIDMTPMFLGGENGGAKLLALELIKGFQSSPADNKFLILTASWNDAELSFLDSPNTRRLCIIKKTNPHVTQSLPLPYFIEQGLRKAYRFIKRKYSEKIHPYGPLHANGVDVLLCPFTAPTYAEPGIPVISVICDLQHKDYPQFFSDKEIYARELFINEVKRRADAIVCISESTKKSLVHHLNLDSDKTFVIPICIQSRLIRNNRAIVMRNLRTLSLDSRPYMFYPANFWPHKNHHMLITAFGMYVARNPESKIDLVFTGALDEAQQKLRDNVRRMGLYDRVHFLGYLPDGQLISVWQGCSFLIFPSLYEGFGIPVLEAMQFGKPVVCGNVTSLPEVAGDAALYFDPRKPEEILQCMENILGNQKLYDELVNRGYERISHFKSQDMVNKYLHVIEEVIDTPKNFHDTAKGIYADGWTGKKLDITYCSEQSGRILECILEVPHWTPYKKAIIRLGNNSGRKQKWVVAQGQRREIKIPLTGNGNHLSFDIKPTFIPSQLNITADNRELGALCKGCYIVSSSGERISLWPGK